uniref:Uncharacterized protein n=1 Tax=Rhizophora mucronata TaxID=61149 RepID=A0A2P2KT80_RHIMU
MGVKVATTCFQWSQPIIPRSPSSSQNLASSISSPSWKKRCRSHAAGASFCRYVKRLDRSALFGTKLYGACSFEYPKSRGGTIKRACSASLDASSDEEFSKKFQDLAFRFQLSEEDDGSSNAVDSEPEIVPEDSRDSLEICQSISENSTNVVKNQRQFSLDSVEPPWSEILQEPPDWSVGDDMLSANIERKANSIEIPLSLRIIKRKIQWQEGFREAGESAYCSVKKAFSSMVFIIRELHSFTLHMREFLFTEDLHGILDRVQKEIHASFVWLFQQVFSHTPTLMVYVMILLANFTVYSIGNNTAIAAPLPAGSYESVSVVEVQDEKSQKFDSATVKTFPVSSSSGKSTSIGGSNGRGGKSRPVASGTEGDGWLHRSDQFATIVPDGGSRLSSLGTTRETESTPRQMTGEEELNLWDLFVKEASKCQASLRGVNIDHEKIQKFVAPITAKIEPDDYAEYFRTELLYQMGLSQEPNNPLLLSNYAHFLYVVAHDYSRAEEFFKRAIELQPPDAEAYSRYANFLWKVRKDLWAAEETFLEAISADPTNSIYAANYAHFLWNTGGEDTCFPLSSPDNNPQEV